MPQKELLTRNVLWVMTLATGICAANLYYNQPLLHQIETEFGVSSGKVGWIPTLTQVGYALGMLLLVPLGDMRERKGLIGIMTLLSAIATLGVAFAPSFTIVAVGSLILGFTTMTPQLIIPFAAHLAPEKKRGQVVGTVMSGLLLGILLARTVAGFVGATFGWRAMFGLASAILIGIGAALHFLLPKSEPTFEGTYLGLLKSVAKIVREQPALREAAFFGAMLFAAFSAFWATLIQLMESPAFGLGARTVGLFGILGAGGALVAPFVGALADRRDPRTATGIMLAVTFFSFVIYYFSGSSLLGLSFGVLVMDIGVQAGHISNQSRVFALLPHARSRVNTAYMFTYFMGGALGSWLGSWSWSAYRWSGVCITGMCLLALGELVFLKNNSK